MRIKVIKHNPQLDSFLARFGLFLFRFLNFKIPIFRDTFLFDLEIQKKIDNSFELFNFFQPFNLI